MTAVPVPLACPQEQQWPTQHTNLARVEAGWRAYRWTSFPSLHHVWVTKVVTTTTIASLSFSRSFLLALLLSWTGVLVTGTHRGAAGSSSSAGENKQRRRRRRRRGCVLFFLQQFSFTFVAVNSFAFYAIPLILLIPDGWLDGLFTGWDARVKQEVTKREQRATDIVCGERKRM